MVSADHRAGERDDRPRDGGSVADLPPVVDGLAEDGLGGLEATHGVSGDAHLLEQVGALDRIGRDGASLVEIDEHLLV